MSKSYRDATPKERIVFEKMRNAGIDKDPQFNLFWYFAVTFAICGLFTFVWYLMSNGL